MDFQRKGRKRTRWLRRGAVTAVALSTLVAATAGISQLKPATPVVDRDQIRIGTVERGTLLIEVRGHGSLVPEDITWVTARVGGQVVRAPVEPGIEVKPDTVLVELWDPNVERAYSEAQRSLKSTEAELQRSRILLDQQVLDLKAATAQAKASFEEAKNQSEMEEELAKRGLIAARQRRLSRDRAERSRMLLEIQVERVKNSVKTNEIQLSEKSAAVERAKEVLQHYRDELNALTVAAGVEGILQHLGSSQDARLEVGQRVGNGAVLAKITNPKRLKAMLRIRETEARDVVLGQTVSIDTRSGIIPGRVIRIDPAVQDSTVTVDVKLQGELPKVARPDLTVDGTIEIERLDQVLYVAKPIYSQPNSTFRLFKLEGDGGSAVRIEVELGRSSIYTTQVVGGLSEGDEVILSDMSDWDEVDRIALR